MFTAARGGFQASCPVTIIALETVSLTGTRLAVSPVSTPTILGLSSCLAFSVQGLGSQLGPYDYPASILSHCTIAPALPLDLGTEALNF